MGRNKTVTTHEEHSGPEGQMQVGGTAIQGLESIPTGRLDDAPSTQHYPPTMGAVNLTDRVIAPKDMPPPPRRFMLMKQGIIVENGLRVTLPEGKVIDSANYDIKMLKGRGFKLREITEEDEDY